MVSRSLSEASTALKIAWRERPIPKSVVDLGWSVDYLTSLVHIVLGFSNLFWVENASNVWLFPNSSKAFGEDNKLMAWDIVFLDRLADDFFTDSIGIDVRSVPRVKPSIICGLKQRK